MILIASVMLSEVVTARQISEEDLKDRLRAGGLKPTRQRVRVLQELAAEPSDITALELHRRLRADGGRVGLSTVYRTLNALASEGVIDSFAHHPGESCFRLCSEGHHHHLVCTNCHRVVELDECGLEAWLDKAAASVGFEATDHRVEIVGLCAECRSPSASI
jgi:Fur family transcriptional regulator, ferric uptake regulator